ncbi:MAG: DUF5058 family protein [Sedimentibacter sp.]|uniref:DUF5058 family protein n=1 Tax=Sedimentibacter sp. TaxID=1960295 RepID=UPI003158A28B
MDHLSMANSPIMFIIVIGILSFLSFQSIYMIKLTLKRADALNIDRVKIKKAMKVACVTSSVPSVAIILGLITLSPVLGLPFSWARLAMAGSLMYEVTAASIGAQTAGAAGLGLDGYNLQAFANSTWIMTLGVFPMMIIAIVATKNYKSSIKKASTKDNAWTGIFVSAIMSAIIANFAVPPVMKGGNGFIAVCVSAIVMLGLIILAKKLKTSWLKEYALSISMISAMAVIAVMSL